MFLFTSVLPYSTSSFKQTEPTNRKTNTDLIFTENFSVIFEGFPRNEYLEMSKFIKSVHGWIAAFAIQPHNLYNSGIFQKLFTQRVLGK